MGEDGACDSTMQKAPWGYDSTSIRQNGTVWDWTGLDSSQFDWGDRKRLPSRIKGIIFGTVVAERGAEVVVVLGTK